MKSCRLLLFVVIIIVAGCAVTPSTAPKFYHAPRPSPNNALLYIYRLEAPPLLHAPVLLIDGRVVFSPTEKSYTWVHISPGQHHVKVDWSAMAGPPDLEFDINVIQQNDNFLKLTGSVLSAGMITNFGARAGMVDPAYALNEVNAKCRYISNTYQ